MSTTHLELSRVLVLVANIGMVIGLYSQVYKVYRLRSAKELSKPFFYILLFSEIAWLNYGIALLEWPIMVICIANLPGIISLLIATFYWGDKNDS